MTEIIMKSVIDKRERDIIIQSVIDVCERDRQTGRDEHNFFHTHTLASPRPFPGVGQVFIAHVTNTVEGAKCVDAPGKGRAVVGV